MGRVVCHISMGALCRFLSEQYGPDMIARLWQASADGNIFRGFDGTLTSRGVLERRDGGGAAAALARVSGVGG